MSLLTVLLAPLVIMLILAVPAGIITYLRYRGIPRYPGPVFPADAAEAERVYHYWQRHNRERTLLTDVRLAEGSVVRNVGFDPDSLVAVQVEDEPVPVWFYRHPIAGALVLGEGLSEAERTAFAEEEAM